MSVAIIKDSLLLEQLAKNDGRALKQLYVSYYSLMCFASFRIISDRQVAEDIAQEVFYEVWRKRSTLNITISLKAYLKRAAVNKTLNYIRDNKIIVEDEEKALDVKDDKISAHRQLEAEEFQLAVYKAIDDLPEKCRIIFGLSRFEELSYKEIASKLDISIKTVENQVSKALKILRRSLSNYQDRENIV